MKSKSYFAFAVFTMLAITACKKTNDPSAVPKPKAAPITDVYVAGTAKPGPGGNYTKAAYWKNGVLMTLSDGTYFAEATGIAVAYKNGIPSAAPLGGVIPPGTTRTDVYVAGNITAPNHNLQAAYWTNGTLIKLTGDTIYAQATAVATAPSKDGINNVYVTGYVTSKATPNTTIATYWQNGKANYLSGGTVARAIAIVPKTDGTADVYIAGTATVNGQNVAAYWKNGGSPIALVVDTPIRESRAFGIAVYGGHVYAAGYTLAISNPNYYTATYWDNGTATELPFVSKAPGSTVANGIAVNGTGIYISGMDDIVSLCWTNGVANALQNGTSTSRYAAGVTLDTKDIYVAGNDGNGSAGYWKNNLYIKLDQASYTNSTAVTSH